MMSYIILSVENLLVLLPGQHLAPTALDPLPSPAAHKHIIEEKSISLKYIQPAA